MLALDKIQLSAHVIFDELSEVGKTTQNSMLEFTESANVEDFKYLENMLFLDGHIIYVTTRVIRQQDLIVAFRAAYVNVVIGQEESRPIYVKDVDNLVDKYILKFCPQVIAAGETKGFFKKGDTLIVLTGWRGGSGNTNTLRIIQNI